MSDLRGDLQHVLYLLPLGHDLHEAETFEIENGDRLLNSSPSSVREIGIESVQSPLVAIDVVLHELLFCYVLVLGRVYLVNCLKIEVLVLLYVN